MTHSLIVLYHHPDDAAAFDQYYEQTHVPLVHAFPGLLSYTGTWPTPAPDGTPAPYHFIATLSFDDAEAFGTALSGPEGQAAVTDLANFAGAGVTLVNGPSVTYL